MATDATRAPGVCLLQHPGVVACLVRPAVDLPQRAPPQVLVGVDQRAPAEEGPLPDLLAGDRVRGRRLIAWCLAAWCVAVWCLAARCLAVWCVAVWCVAACWRRRI